MWKLHSSQDEGGSLIFLNKLASSGDVGRFFCPITNNYSVAVNNLAYKDSFNDNGYEHISYYALRANINSAYKVFVKVNPLLLKPRLFHLILFLQKNGYTWRH